MWNCWIILILFSILRKYETIHGNDTILYFCWQYMRVPVSPYPCQCLLFRLLDCSCLKCVMESCGFDLHFPNNLGCWVFLPVFIVYLYIFFDNNLFKSFAYFLIGYLFFCCWIVGVLYILWTLETSYTWFGNNFSNSVSCLFTFVSILRCTQKLSMLMESNLVFLCRLIAVNMSYLRSHC